jgi:hypothetical protein
MQGPLTDRRSACHSAKFFARFRLIVDTGRPARRPVARNDSPSRRRSAISIRSS